MDIGGWLRGLGLERYEAVFRDNEIDETVLRDLSEDHLRELGFPLGARLKLLKAIAGLDAPAGSAISAPAGEAASLPAKDAAERRQVTVLFSDLVGSTALSARMDPEDLREVISAYQKCVAEAVRRCDGFVAKYLGDGALVYFGYPQAHEDDAERAVRAGLDLIAAVTALKSPVPLQTRVGIATGLVVVGDLIGSGEAQERGIVGETPNLAARLQGIAEPNTVVIAESTRRLLGKLFELEALGARNLKGIAGPVRAWAAVRSSSVEGRFEALHGAGLTELVGREEEVELLLRRWSRAKAGEGQVVLISGEAGIGKSRVTAALMEHLASQPHTRLRYFCSPQHTDSALYPIIGQMERAASLAHVDSATAKLDKLDVLLGQTSTPAQDAALFAEMLSLANDGRYPALDLDPQQRRQRTLQALISQLEALARQKPILMVFEDAHWTDPTSLEAFGRIVDRIAALRGLLIVTFRREFDPPWIGRPHVTALTINRLTQHDVGAMIDRLVGNKLLPGSIRQDIVERTDGIPLFVEEMTKAVLEVESPAAAERAAAAIPSPAFSVPATLHASLMARLDRLGPAKEVAQIGSAIGREFSHALLATVVGKPEGELLSALDRLVAAGLLFRHGVPPHAAYLFKHALVQDAAYGMLLREPRRALHARIAEALESQFPEVVESQPELLARHANEAGLIEKAAGLWGKAGQRSLARSALVEAAEQLTRALAEIAALPGTALLRRQELTLQFALRHALVHLKGYAAPETKAAVERIRLLIEQAEALGESPEDPLLLFSLLNSTWTANIVAFNGDAACELATEFLARADRQNAVGPVIDGHRLLGTSLLMSGDIAGGRAHFDRGIALASPIEHSPPATSLGGDAGVVILGFRSMSLWLLGFPDAALADASHALCRARMMTPVGTLMHILSWTISLQILCGHYSTAGALVDELIGLADEKDTLFWKAWGMMNRGWLLALNEKPSDATHTLMAGISAWQSTGATMCVPFYSSCLAGTYAQLHQFEKTHELVREAAAMIESTGEKWFEAETHRLMGEILLKSPNSSAANAERHFEHALSVSRTRHTKSWELRAAMSMARLWRDQDKRQEAYDLLAPVYGWFTEGFDTLDLKQAKKLLSELV